MILTLNDLLARLQPIADPDDTQPSEALWVKFSQGRSRETIDYRTADENTIVHVYLDDDGHLVGIEIFP